MPRSPRLPRLLHACYANFCKPLQHHLLSKNKRQSLQFQFTNLFKGVCIVSSPFFFHKCHPCTLDNIVPEAYHSHPADGACVARHDGSTLPCQHSPIAKGSSTLALLTHMVVLVCLLSALWFRLPVPVQVKPHMAVL